MRSGTPAAPAESFGATRSRRHALATLLGAGSWLQVALSAADRSASIRFAISETMMTDVNVNDARAAMRTWLKRVAQDTNLTFEFSPNVFDTTDELVNRARSGQLDSAALNVVEYRQIADVFDPSQIVSVAGAGGLDQYILLVKRNGALHRLGDLRGLRLRALKSPRMCVASAWLSTILDEGHYGPSEQFFGSVTTDTKVARVVLPVFFGQADACLTSKRGFDTMCELNPQVGRELTTIASSPAVVVIFYIFRKNYQSASREQLIKVLSGLRSTPAGLQLATLFQFDEVTVRDSSCLVSALSLLDAADRIRGKQTVGSRKG